MSTAYLHMSRVGVQMVREDAQRRDLERQLAQEAVQRVDLERQLAQEAVQRAHLERQLDLERQLAQEAVQRANLERQLAQEAVQRANLERQLAERTVELSAVRCERTAMEEVMHLRQSLAKAAAERADLERRLSETMALVEQQHRSEGGAVGGAGGLQDVEHREQAVVVERLGLPQQQDPNERWFHGPP